MAEHDGTQRAAAICDNCETAHAVRLAPDGEVRPIGTGQGAGCTCGDSELRVLSDATSIRSDVEMESS